MQPKPLQHYPIDIPEGFRSDRVDFCESILSEVDISNPKDIRGALAIASKRLIEDGASSFEVTSLITETADRLLEQCIEAAIKELGEPPVPWMFMLMGSEGRSEQTLRTDQDSAIVFEQGDHAAYFLTLGKFVSDTLHTFGFLYCKGDVMASNPKWVLPLDSWKKTFRNWVQEPEPMAIMQACIFFDFRCGYGQTKLGDELHSYIQSLLGGRNGLFFYHMAQNAMKFGVALGFFGGIKRSSKTSLDIKKAMLPIIDHARIYGLNHHIKGTSTLERIDALAREYAFKGADATLVKQVFGFLNEIRLLHQIQQMEQNLEPDNIVNPSNLSKECQRDLTECLKITQALQQNITLTFRGNLAY